MIQISVHEAPPPPVIQVRRAQGVSEALAAGLFLGGLAVGCFLGVVAHESWPRAHTEVYAEPESSVRVGPADPAPPNP